MNPEQLLAVIAEHYGMGIDELRSGRRTRFRTWGRHVAAYLLRRTGRYSYSDIARILRYGDHTGVIDAIGRVRRQIESDAAARDDVAELEALLGDQIPDQVPRRVSRPLFPLRRNEGA